MVRMLPLVGALACCAVVIAAQPAAGADRLLCVADTADGTILVPAPGPGPEGRPGAASPRRDPVVLLDGALAPETAGTALRRWTGERFATPRNAEVLDAFFKARGGSARFTVVA